MCLLFPPLLRVAAANCAKVAWSGIPTPMPFVCLLQLLLLIPAWGAGKAVADSPGSNVRQTALGGMEFSTCTQFVCRLQQLPGNLLPLILARGAVYPLPNLPSRDVRWQLSSRQMTSVVGEFQPAMLLNHSSNYV